MIATDRIAIKNVDRAHCTHSISRVAVSLNRGEARFSYWPSAEIQPGAAASALDLQLDWRKAA